MSKLILFIHGLGGDKETWGNFETIIKEDKSFDSSYKVEFYEYNTALLIAKGILPHLGWGGKLLSFFFKNKPKIQDVAKLLKTDIDHEYNEYEEIYLVVHSMGGLVSLKYLVDELNHNKPLKVKKLLLYDVPHKGSHFAKLSSFYKHAQILQLDKSSDFLDALTNINEFKTIEDKIEVKCISCLDGKIVDKASAQAHYKNVYELERTHTSIVKPVNSEDIVYKTFQKFMVEKSTDTFIENIFSNLSNEIFVLLHQKHTHIAPQVATIQSKSSKLFKEHFYHFVTPNTSKTKYYEKLGALIGTAIKNATEFEEEMGAIAQKHKLLLYIDNFERNSEERALELSTAIRKLKNNHPNFHAILIGQEKLAKMVYRTDSTLSPLQNSIKKVFPNNGKIEYTNLAALVRALNPHEREWLQDYLESDNIGDFDLGDELKMKLFWCNIVTKQGSNDKLVWKDKETQNLFRELMKEVWI